MKQTLTLLSFLSLGITQANAQDFINLRNDNYSGVNSAFTNPANLATSPYKIDLNLFGMDLFLGNKNVNLSINSLTNMMSDSNALNSLYGSMSSNSLAFNFGARLPSISYQVNEKLTVAFTSRARIMFSFLDLDGNLFNSISGSVDKATLPLNLSGSNNMRLTVNAFTDYGLSGAYNVYNENGHYVSAGLSLKMLAGVGNTYMQLDNVKATIDTTQSGAVVAKNASGKVAFGVGGLDISNPSFSLAANGTGFGFDIGGVYEYRPENLAGEAFPYLFKVQASILDLGSIKYNVINNQNLDYTINIPTAKSFDLSKFDGAYRDTLAKYPQYFTPGAVGSSYKVKMPTTFQFGGDFRAIKNVYVALNTQFKMVSNESDAFNPYVYGWYNITPRYEGKAIAAYLPITMSSFTRTNIGFGLRLGPLYAGSSSLVSWAMGNSSQIDFNFGFHFGIKSRSFKDRFSSNKEDKKD